VVVSEKYVKQQHFSAESMLKLFAKLLVLYFFLLDDAIRYIKQGVFPQL